MTPTQALMQRVARRWAPPSRKTVAQWAEEKRYLSEKNSAFPGRFSFAILPFLREPLECLSDRRKAF